MTTIAPGRPEVELSKKPLQTTNSLVVDKVVNVSLPPVKDVGVGVANKLVFCAATNWKKEPSAIGVPVESDNTPTNRLNVTPDASCAWAMPTIAKLNIDNAAISFFI